MHSMERLGARQRTFARSLYPARNNLIRYGVCSEIRERLPHIEQAHISSISDNAGLMKTYALGRGRRSTLADSRFTGRCEPARHQNPTERPINAYADLRLAVGSAICQNQCLWP